MKKISWLGLLFFANIHGASAQSIELIPDGNGDQNYLMLLTKKTLFPDAYRFQVITNFSRSSKNGAQSAASDYSLNCRMKRIGYLSWHTYAKPWAKGKVVSRDDSQHFEQVEDHPKNLQLLNLICNTAHQELT